MTPYAEAVRFIRVSDGTECDPVGANFGNDLQAFDASFQACVPVFARDGAFPASLVGTQTVTTCLEPEGGGTNTIELTVGTEFLVADNPGLTSDLVLPTQTYNGAGIDSGGFGCQGDFGEPGAAIPGTAWFPVPDPACIDGCSGIGIDFNGMVIPIDGNQAGATNSDLLVAAAQEAFSEANGFVPIPLILTVGLDGSNEVTSATDYCGLPLGSYILPTCSGSATSERYAIEVFFAQPAGFLPPAVPAMPFGGAIVLLGCIGGAGWLLTRRRGEQRA